MQMPYFVRPRNSGRTFELRAKHCRLPKPVYRNFDLQDDAQRAGRDQVARTLQRIANQPGFHGVRAQALALFEFATARGYSGPLPPLFFVQKVAHGKPMAIV
jgi:hypothetical protein